MALVEATKRVARLQPGQYTASSLTPGYGSLLALVESKKARYLGEHIDDDGVKTIAVEVGRRSNTGRRNPAIGISREFFTTVLKDYEDWREKWWREAVQNSVDARATQIDCLISENSDGTFTVSSTDNGGGMDEDVLLNKFLMLGGSTKKLGGGAAGGFGKAKELLILPWLSWRVLTRDREIRGDGIDYTVHEAPYFDGTRIEVVMPADQTTSNSAAIALIQKCYLPKIRFTVTNRRLDGREEIAHPKADLKGNELLEEVEGKAEVYVAKVDYESYRMLIRVQGIYMFNRWVTHVPGKQIIVEITAPSTEVLTANRDGFRDTEITRRLDALTDRLSKDTISALRSMKGLIRKKYQGKGKFQAERARSEALAQISYVEPTTDGHAEMNISDIRRIADVLEIRRDKLEVEHSYSGRSGGDGPAATFLPGRALSTELLQSVDFTGAHHVEEAVRQLAWDPDFYLINEIEGFKVPKKYYPETMKPAVVKLARVWTEMCRYVLMQLGSFRPFGIGFIFSEDAGAAYQEDGDEHWLLLNPFVKPRYREGQWTPGKPEDLKRLYAYAIHECTHLADGISYHDESFAAALTNNFAKTADGFRKIRKIVGAIRVGESATADVAENPRMLNPGPALPDHRLTRLSRRIVNGGF